MNTSTLPLQNKPFLYLIGLKKALTILVFMFSFISVYSDSNKFNLTFIVKNGTSPDKSVSLTDYMVTYKTKEKKEEEKEEAPIRREKGFRLDVELNEEYLFTFSKNGFISKSILIDTHVPDKRDRDKFEKMQCIITLEKAPIEFIIANAKPIQKIVFRTEKNQFDYDPNYSFTLLDVDLIKKRDKVFSKGLTQLHEGKYKEALEVFTTMLKKNPIDIAALHNHGKAALKLNDTKTACEDWNAIKDLNKEYADDLLKEYCSGK